MSKNSFVRKLKKGIVIKAITILPNTSELFWVLDVIKARTKENADIIKRIRLPFMSDQPEYLNNLLARIK